MRGLFIKRGRVQIVSEWINYQRSVSIQNAFCNTSKYRYAEMLNYDIRIYSDPAKPGNVI